MQKTTSLHPVIAPSRCTVPKASVIICGNTRSSLPRSTFFGKPFGEVATNSSVVVSCKPTKAAEFREMNFEEIDAAVEECKKELYLLRAQIATRQPVKTHMFKYLRKKVAQLLTVRRQKELDMGINKRQSRKLEIKRRFEKGELPKK